MPTRIPTIEEFAAYSGAHTHALWRDTGDDWCCPVCRRSKYQIMTWTKRQSGWGWLAPLCEQVDKMNWPFGDQRFPETVICQHCNRAGYNVQRKLGLHVDFRFAPTELSRFVSSNPHERATYDLVVADRVVAELRAAGVRPL